MKKIWEVIKTILWSISIIFVWPYAGLVSLSIKSKSKKYKKYKVEYLAEERYAKVYSLTRLIKYLYRLKVKQDCGREKILMKPQLMVANHRSEIDPIILFNLLYKQIGQNYVFVAKKELSESKYAYVFDLIDTIYLDRENPRDAIKVIEKEKEEIKKGKIVIVFPEGTRNTNQELLEFKPGAFEPAYKAMCPIQPVIITHSNEYKEDKKEFKKHRKTIEVNIMEEYKPHSFISINRVIFAKNIHKNMQHKYNEMTKND